MLCTTFPGAPASPYSAALTNDALLQNFGFAISNNPAETAAICGHDMLQWVVSQRWGGGGGGDGDGGDDDGAATRGVAAKGVPAEGRDTTKVTNSWKSIWVFWRILFDLNK